jgi:hypothetical protein
MNAAIFPMDYPQQEPFIGDSTVLVVNDCRLMLLCVQRLLQRLCQRLYNGFATVSLHCTGTI